MTQASSGKPTKRTDRLMVGVTAFQSLPLSDDEKRRLARRLQDAHPESVVGSVLAASLAANRRQDRVSRLARRVRAASWVSIFDIRARSLAMREALMSLGQVVP